MILCKTRQKIERIIEFLPAEKALFFEDGRFVGTIKSFQSYYDPKIREIIKNWGVPIKRMLNGRCQWCGCISELEAMHYKNMSRIKVNEMCLKTMCNKEGLLDIDLKEAFPIVIKENKRQIEAFVCPKCHVSQKSKSDVLLPEFGIEEPWFWDTCEWSYHNGSCRILQIAGLGRESDQKSSYSK